MLVKHAEHRGLVGGGKGISSGATVFFISHKLQLYENTPGPIIPAAIMGIFAEMTHSYRSSPYINIAETHPQSDIFFITGLS